MDLVLADKAYELGRAGKTGPEIAKAIGVQHASEAHAHAAVGRARASAERARLTDPEVLLLRCLAAEERALLARGQCRSPKSHAVSWRAGKSRGWANATASKRLGSHRKGEDDRLGGTGFRMVKVAGNGHIWLTPAGWAVVHAIEAAA
ncbi:MAG TPA: hypothetical protein VFT56_01205 [Sphingomonas sp.]|nr:hypothetical protein [Sphingomonas sp.]